MSHLSEGRFPSGPRFVAAAIFFLILSLFPFLIAAGAEELATSDDIDFTAMSFEELKNVVIVIASKKPEKLSDADAAVFVITQDDIRRSGATTIADALRLAPGVQVARVNTHSWAISVRGFNGIYSNKLLVLIDGRSVYSPIYSGVFWDVQDTVLEDIDRIEIIRGPGSSLWGANAVNGVINIITKPAKDTQGLLISLGNGTVEREFGSIRYGGEYSENLDYRIYAKGFQRDEIDDSQEKNIGGPGVELGEEAEIDNWWNIRGGFRLDWAPSPSDGLSLFGETWFNRDTQDVDDELETRSKTHGGHLVGEWRHTISETSDTLFRLYFDQTDRDSEQAKYAIRTIDTDFQHRFSLFGRHEITWGIGYRYIMDNLENYNLMQFDPDERDYDFFNSFVQDEISLFENRIRLTIGTKFENSEFSDFEVQPCMRVLWKPVERHSVWGAISRAATVPSRMERDGISVVNRGETWTEVQYGNEDIDAEKVTAFEAGYRIQPREKLFLDFAVFYNDYDDLLTREMMDPPGVPRQEDPPPKLEIGTRVGNKMEGETYGFEIAADWLVLDRWRIRPAYSFLEMNLETDGSNMQYVDDTEGGSPKHQLSIFSTFDITKSIDFDLWFRAVDNLSARHADAYAELDARLAWRPIPKLELSLAGQNLLDESHAEFSTQEVERSAYIEMTWHY